MRRCLLGSLVLALAGCPDTDEVGGPVILDTVVAPDTVETDGRSTPPEDFAPAGEEVGTDEEAGGEDAGPWVMDWPKCTENGDCKSGYCVETADGKFCTATCIDACPKDWYCGEVSNTGTDVTYICIPRYVTLCRPCTEDKECAGALGQSARCLSYGPEGSFCGAECTEEIPCPGGYECTPDGQCKRLAGEACECSWKAIKDGAQTTCSATNEWGTCQGTRGCLEGTLSSCYAATPGEEVCDGDDNDCDGQVDEETAGEACEIESVHGTCPGQTACSASGLICKAQVPEVEICDGKDNDCDEQVDEGFPDSDGDGVADCIEQDDDSDGVPDITDNCPATPNGDQADMDEDGLGDVCDTDLDGDGDPNTNDCQPYDPAVGHKVPEICNGQDDDCDTKVDQGFPDLDGDSVADCVDDDDDGDGVADEVDNCAVTPNPAQTDTDADGIGDACEDDADADGDPDLTDCEPTNPGVHHAADEQCNAKDENCNGIIDEGFSDLDGDGVANCMDDDDDGDLVPDADDVCPLTFDPEQSDLDGDGAGNACDADDDGDGEPDGLDCAPLDPSVNHKVAETCNGKDDDCDSIVDEDGAGGCSDWFFDDDGDGFGLEGVTKCLCKAGPPFTASKGGDCNDKNPQVFPGATEACNAQDDDCDGKVDEGAATGCKDSWPDGDKDGYGAGEPVCVCPGVTGYAPTAGDCDDKNPKASPFQAELCNGFDDDCNGLADEEGAGGCKTWYLDFDKDGFGKSTAQKCLCAAAGDYSTLADDDCDDADPGRFPGNPETCDEKDNNCNGQVDEGVKKTWFVDEDGDGYGASYNQQQACAAPDGFVAKAGDCNDYNGEINPSAPEACNDIDDNCNGKLDEPDPANPDDPLAKMAIYVDLDGDGFGTSTGAPAKKCLYDTDTDGKGDTPPLGYSLVAKDCNDSNSTVFPGAPELCDGLLNDCGKTIPDQACPKVCAGSWPVSVGGSSGYAVIAQLDNDNELEVVAQNEGHVRVLEHDGTVKWDVSLSVSYSYPTLADFNGDDTADLVVPVHGGTTHVLNGSTGAILASYATGTNAGYYGSVVFDVDGDGMVDIVPTGSAPYKLVLLNADLTVKSTISLAPLSGEHFGLTSPALYDFGGNGKAEIMVGSGNWTCVSSPESCKGRHYVFNADGTLYNDPTWTDPAMPWFHVPFYPTSFAGEGRWVAVADVDGDGSAEVLHSFSNAAGAGKSFVWNKDGTEHALSGKVGGSFPVLAPIDGNGNPSEAGALTDAGGPVVDLEGDGGYEIIRNVTGGLGILKQGKVMDGWPVKQGGRPVIGDIDRDGRLDIVVLSGHNNAVNCFTLGPATYADERILSFGTLEGLSRNHYSTGNLDPFEPNDFRGMPFVPESAKDPVKESRAIHIGALRDTYSSGGGWNRLIRATIGEKGDRDFYVMYGGIINVQLWGLARDYDLHVHMFTPGGQFVATWSSTKTGLTSEGVNCHSTTSCPSGSKTFVIEVRPKDPEVDFGPFPYLLRTNWAN